MNKKKSSKQAKVDTGRGDRSGDNKTVTASGRSSVAIGGNVSGSTITVGSKNIIASKTEQTFSAIYKKIDDQPTLTSEEKADLRAETQEVEAELKKGDEADESFIARRLSNIKNMAPDILEVILATMGNPATGLGMVAKKLAAKMGDSAS